MLKKVSKMQSTFYIWFNATKIQNVNKFCINCDFKTFIEIQTFSKQTYQQYQKDNQYYFLYLNTNMGKEHYRALPVVAQD